MATALDLTISQNESPNKADCSRGPHASSPMCSPAHNKRSGTLGARNLVRPTNTSQHRPPDFTRIRRLNTFKFVQRPVYHPPLKGKALSLNGMSYGNRRDSDNQQNGTNTPLNMTSSDSSGFGTPPEVQEIIMTFAAAQMDSSSTFSTSSDMSSHNETLTSPTSSIPAFSPTSTNELCAICCKEMNLSLPLVIFGDTKQHLNCFKCGKCQCPMGAMKEFLVQVDGTPLCTECTPSCHICHEKIFHNHVSVLKKNFHEDCLACSRCKRKFNILTKVYSNDGEPCCASCISPVFSDIWGPTKCHVHTRSHPSLHAPRRTSVGSNKRIMATMSPSPSTDSGVSDSTSNDGHSEQLLHTLPASENFVLNPCLESLSRSIVSYSSHNTLNRMRGSVSAPNLSEGMVINSKRLSVSSLRDILFDETGSLLFLCHCVGQCAVELIAFWLDVEHYRHFDGGIDDLKLFAHHTILKYIGYYAELPVPLPRDIQSDIFQTMELGVTQSMFNEAQQYILQYMERELLPGFLNSYEGKSYIESVVERELIRMKKKTPNTSIENLTETFVLARVTKFDKRYMDTKYYVYEVEVKKSDGSSYTIYRRYSEWYSFNQKLRKAFPKVSFPRLPKKIFLRRSQVRAVAEERMKQIEFYLQGLFTLNREVLNCRILRNFLTQTEMDKEDEQFNKRVTELQKKRPSS